MTDGNGRTPPGEATAQSDEWVTVAEAAEQLGVTIPRLRRLLARPEYASCVRQVDRQTKTGTRTATVVSVLVFPQLKAGFENKIGEQEQERKQEQKADSVLVHTLSSAYEMTLRERGRVIEEQAARIADLQAALEHEREQMRRLQDALAREQTLRAIAPAGTQNEPTAREVSAEEKRATARRWWEFWKA